MFSIQTVKQISPKTDGNIALFGENSALILGDFLPETSKKFFGKKLGPRLSGSQHQGYQCFLLLFIEQTVLIFMGGGCRLGRFLFGCG